MAAENAYLRAQIAALQKEVDTHVARETARLQQQREETARRKQELKAQRKAMMEQRGLDFEPDSSRTSEIGREDAEVATNSVPGSGIEDDSDDYDIAS